MQKLVVGKLASMRAKAIVVFAVVACVALTIVPMALATETPAEEKVKTLAEKVGTEGTSMFLVVVAAIAGLLAVIIGVTLGIKKIRSFVK